MATYIFQRLAQKGAKQGFKIGSRDSIKWFRDQAQAIKRVNRNGLLNENKTQLVDFITNRNIGRMYMFFYDAKHKKTLPYWDKFPMIFPISHDSDSFTGINLHYLPPVLRIKLMNSLYDTMTNKEYDDTTKLRLNYSMLNSAAKFKYFKPCIKKYLRSHVQSRFLEVKPEQWDISLLLPTQKFAGATQEQVWKDSRKTING